MRFGFLDTDEYPSGGIICGPNSNKQIQVCLEAPQVSHSESVEWIPKLFGALQAL